MATFGGCMTPAAKSRAAGAQSVILPSFFPSAVAKAKAAMEYAQEPQSTEVAHGRAAIISSSRPWHRRTPQ